MQPPPLDAVAHVVAGTQAFGDTVGIKAVLVGPQQAQSIRYDAVTPAVLLITHHHVGPVMMQAACCCRIAHTQAADGGRSSSEVLGMLFAANGVGCLLLPLLLNPFVPANPKAWSLAVALGFMIMAVGHLPLVLPRIILPACLVGNFVRAGGEDGSPRNCLRTSRV
jgi:hypothetical protein